MAGMRYHSGRNGFRYAHGGSTSIGTQPSDLVSFHGAAGSAQKTAIAAVDVSVVDATYGAQEQAVLTDLRTKLNSVLVCLKDHGLTA